MDPELEQYIKDCVSIRDDMSKCAKSRSIARTGIEHVHIIVDLKNENERLGKQIEELREKLKNIPEAS